MSLTAYSLLIAAAAAILGILGEWTGGGQLIPVWRIVIGLWLAGLVYEWIAVRRLDLSVEFGGGSDRLFLGRRTEMALALRCDSGRDVTIKYAPALPDGLGTGVGSATAMLTPGVATAASVDVLPRRLGVFTWERMPARVLGRLRLAWWSHPIHLHAGFRVLPDTLASGRVLSLGSVEAGTAQRAVIGGGGELLHLRPYQPGDPRRALDWKATARAGRLISRVSSEDQHLEIVVAIDAGRTSRVESGGMSHFAHFANMTARFAEYAILNEDRVGLVVFADRPLVSLSPGRGADAVQRIRRTLTDVQPRPVESDTVAAVLHLRSLVRRRALVILLTDLYERSATSQLAETVRILRPPHLPVIAGLIGDEVTALRDAPAVQWIDPYRSLAATEYEHDVRANVARLRRMGASAMTARPADLDRTILECYRRLRVQRRI